MQQALHISEELHFTPLPVICLPHVSEWVISAGEIPPNYQIRNGRSCRLGQAVTAILLPDPSPLSPCNSDDLGLHSSGHPSASIKQCRPSKMPHLDKKHPPSRLYSSLGTQASGKVGNSDGEEGNKGTLCWCTHPAQQCLQKQVLASMHIHTRTCYITYTELCNPFMLINKQRPPQMKWKTNKHDLF